MIYFDINSFEMRQNELRSTYRDISIPREYLMKRRLFKEISRIAELEAVQ